MRTGVVSGSGQRKEWLVDGESVERQLEREEESEKSRDWEAHRRTDVILRSHRLKGGPSHLPERPFSLVLFLAS